MELTFFIQLMIGIPLIGFVLSLIIPESRENLLSKVAFYTAGLNLISILVLLVLWGLEGFGTVNVKEFVLYRNSNFEFLIDFFFDRVGAVYVAVGALLS
jgi:NADH-quinone oxidoreductase subunit L